MSRRDMLPGAGAGDAGAYLDSIGAPELFEGLVGCLLRERPKTAKEVGEALVRQIQTTILKEHSASGKRTLAPLAPISTEPVGTSAMAARIAAPRSPHATSVEPRTFPGSGGGAQWAGPASQPLSAAPLPAAQLEDNTTQQNGTDGGIGRRRSSLARMQAAASGALAFKKFGVRHLHVSQWTAARKYTNPMKLRYKNMNFTDESVAVQMNIVEAIGTVAGFKHSTAMGKECIQVAGPAEDIWFEPSQVKAAIVCTGGLCPGLNSIIRDVTMGLWNSYNVRQIYGIAYGFCGFDIDKYPMVELNPQVVEEIHTRGGSIIGCNRGGFDPEFIVDTMEREGINQLYTLGGDGSLWTSDVLAQLVMERRLPAVVIGIPKSIDCDVMYVDRTFGFHTAVEEGTRAIQAAYIEATAVPRGVGIVKLMGRDAGFVARNATLAVGSIVDVALIPEVPFTMNDLQGCLDEVLDRKGHAVIVVAEGAGQEMMAGGGKDATGHTVYSDIGKMLKNVLNEHLKSSGGRTFLIDPSYMIRAVEPDPNDNMYCSRIALMAAHSAMRGYNGITVGAVHDKMVMIPTTLIAEGTRRVDPVTSSAWQRCLEVTGMPECLAGQTAPAKKPGRPRGHPSMYRQGGKFYDKMRAGGKGGTGT